MPLYMDVHTLDGEVTVDDVAKAHMADLQIQSKYDVRYLRYWVDEKAGKIFCLVESPSPDASTDRAPRGARTRRRRGLRSPGGIMMRTSLIGTFVAAAALVLSAGFSLERGRRCRPTQVAAPRSARCLTPPDGGRTTGQPGHGGARRHPEVPLVRAAKHTGTGSSGM